MRHEVRLLPIAALQLHQAKISYCTSNLNPRLKKDDLTPTKAMLVKAKFVVALAATLALCFWWLLSDREPTQKEMTFAYRKHVIAIDSDRNSKDLVDLRNRLHAIRLIKQHCDKLDEKRYRCESTALMDDHRVEGRPAAGNAIYSRDAKGWRFEAIGEEWRPPAR